jgi:transcriptional regulator with GAF, ATPase, and Fis domain
MEDAVLDIDTSVMDELNKTAWSINRKEAQKAIDLSKEAFEKSNEIGYKKGMALALKTMGAAHIWISKNEEALEYSFKAIELLKEIGDKFNEAEMNYYVGANFFYLSDYDTAIKYYNNCFDINNSIGHEPGMADGLNGLGTVYYTIEQNDKALDILMRSKELCVKHNTKSVLVKVLDGLGETYYNLKEYKSALSYYDFCIDLAREMGGVEQVEAFALDGQGRAYTHLKDFDKAFEKYEMSLNIRQKLGFKAGEAMTLNNMGNLFIAKGDFAKALTYLEQAFELSQKINSKEGVYKSSEKLAEVYELTGRFEEAIKFHKTFNSAREEVRNEKTNQLVKSVELQHKMLQSQAEKLLLEEKAKELENHSNNLVLIGEIGQQIISHLSVAKIVETVYGHVNTLMDATGFGIGLVRSDSSQVVFPLFIEDNERFENITYNLSDNDRLAVICYTQNKDIIINHFDTDIHTFISKYQAPLFGKKVQSIIYLPLIVKGKTVGVITVQSFKENAYASYHVNILKNLAAFAAIALENAQMYEEQEKRVAERTQEVVHKKEEIEGAYKNNKLLSEIGQQITSTLNFEEIFDKLHHYVNQLMDAACFGIRLYDPVRNVVDYKYGIERGHKYLSIASISMDDDDNYSVWCIKNKKEIFLNDNLNEYQKYVKQIKVVSGDMPHSLIFYPILMGERVLGVITIQSFEKFAYKEYHLDILKTLASYIAIALDNASLYENMEEKVKARTLEVTKQKEEIEKTYENTRLLSQVGKDITATLSIEEIIQKVYNNVNSLMDATTFGIGVYNADKAEIVFPATIEKGITLPEYSYKMENIARPAVWCYTEQKDYVIHNFSEYARKQGKTFAPVSGETPESIIYVPVTQNDKKIGVITVQSFTPGIYNDYHLQILKNLAVYVAIAIDNASLYENMELRVQERTEEIEKNYSDTKLLSQVAEDISASLSVETIISKVYENVNKLVKADCFGIGIFDPKSGRLEFRGFMENDERMEDFGYAANDPNRLAAQCFSGLKEIFINDYAVEYVKYIKGMKAPVSGKDSSSIIYLPVYSKGEAIGVITVQSFETNAYTSYHLNILKNLAVSVGIALDNANLYQNLEEKVKERTLEVVKQKEEIEKTYENTRLLSQIGKDITATLSISSIIEQVYNNVNALMDASVFAIGIFSEDSKRLEFPGTMEKGIKLEDFSYGLTDDTLSVWCFNNDKEIFINDYALEYSKYIKTDYSAAQGDDTVAMMFLPIHGKNRKLGVISVQSFKTNAYSDYHLNIIRNLAVYIGIALDNASLYTNMEDRVKERTAEIEKNYNDTKLLSQIAEEISSCLSVQAIIEKVHQKVNNLMRADAFGIALFNAHTNMLEFKGFVERGQVMPDSAIDVKDLNRLATQCLMHEKEIMINDYSVEYSKYIKGIQRPISGKDSASIIYLPIFSKEICMGVITVQSYQKDAYTAYHFNILKNLAISVGIALDNANLYQNLEEKVRERTTEVIEQKAIIEEKNKDITDSIKYAKKIQQALMPDKDILKKGFPESFVYYRPKDIVSGDFYWIENFNDEVIVFAAADCTGHGVPGAFMSLICNDLMSQVIKDNHTTSPGKALKAMDEKLRAMLNKSADHSANDGMDLALCAYHPKKKIMQFAGAHRPLLLIRNGELIEYKPSKHSIGGYLTGDKVFEDHEIQVLAGDSIYILTDGYSDQFGGQNGKKFKFKKLQKLIQSIAHMSMKEQHDLLDESFVSWRGRHEQVDDICVIGVKI